jgi:hypothetical protein
MISDENYCMNLAGKYLINELDKALKKIYLFKSKAISEYDRKIFNQIIPI